MDLKISIFTLKKYYKILKNYVNKVKKIQVLRLSNTKIFILDTL